MKNTQAFSLIELSIVLIIIGLLVAGVTGGASLIQSARIRALANELNGWKQAVWAFKAATGRYPGDRDNIGKFGYLSGYTYEKTDFAPPFDTGNFTPGPYSAPFIELYTEKISDFKPTSVSTRGTAYPKSKLIPEISYQYRFNTSTTSVSASYLYGFKANINTIFISYYGANTTTNIGFNPKYARDLDLKVDDGEYNGGSFRYYCCKMTDGVNESCGSTSYEDSINSKSVCSYGSYDLKLE